MSLYGRKLNVVAIVGAAGVMGGGKMRDGQQTLWKGGFALVFAALLQRIDRLILIDQDEDGLRAVVEAIEAKLGKKWGDQTEAMLAKIHCSREVSAAGGADLVFEVIPERLDAKQAIFAALAGVAPDAMLLTNTSGLLLDQIVGGLSPEVQARTAVCHGFAPAQVSPVMEIAGGSHTDPALLDWLHLLWAELRKIPIRVAPHRMHALNFLGTVIWRELTAAIDEGLISAGQGDLLAAQIFGLKLGPFALRQSTGYVALHSNTVLLADMFPALTVPECLRKAAEEGLRLATAADLTQGDSTIADEVRAQIVLRLRCAYFWAVDYLIERKIVDPAALNWAIAKGLFMRDIGSMAGDVHPDEITGMIGDFTDNYSIEGDRGALTALLSSRGAPQFEEVRYEVVDGVAVITVCRPWAINALSTSVRVQLDLARARAEAATDVRAIVICGEGLSFPCGADVTELDRLDTHADGYARSLLANAFVDRWRRCPKPVVAAMAGHTLGGGFELALCATLRIAAIGTRAGFPEVRNVRVIPGSGGIWNFAQVIRRQMDSDPDVIAATLRWVRESHFADTPELERLGVVSEVVPLEQLVSRASDLARQLASGELSAPARSEDPFEVGEFTPPPFEELADREGLSREVDMLSIVPVFNRLEGDREAEFDGFGLVIKHGEHHAAIAAMLAKRR